MRRQVRHLLAGQHLPAAGVTSRAGRRRAAGGRPGPPGPGCMMGGCHFSPSKAVSRRSAPGPGSPPPPPWSGTSGSRPKPPSGTAPCSAPIRPDRRAARREHPGRFGAARRRRPGDRDRQGATVGHLCVVHGAVIGAEALGGTALARRRRVGAVPSAGDLPPGAGTTAGDRPASRPGDRPPTVTGCSAARQPADSPRAPESPPERSPRAGARPPPDPAARRVFAPRSPGARPSRRARPPATRHPARMTPFRLARPRRSARVWM